MLLCLIACSLKKGQAQTAFDPEALKQKVGMAATASPAWFTASLALVDGFMLVERYDSAQQWLTKIAEKLPANNSLFNYYHHSRQAEIYYYNSLQRLGLTESKRALSIATLLNDSLLLADANNFIGLFYMNMDSIAMATAYFKKGITYTQAPPYNVQYVNITMPHHLFGNLAEAYQRNGRYDSAIAANNISLQYAQSAKEKRPLAIAHLNQGSIYDSLHQIDSAIYHYTIANTLGSNNNIWDVQLLSYSKLALGKSWQHNKAASLELLNKGLALLEQHPYVNVFFAGMFFDDAIKLYKQYNESLLLANLLQKKAASLQAQLLNNNQQVQTILDASLANETRLLQLQVNTQRQQNEIVNTRLYLLLAVLLLVIAGFLLYRYKTSQRLQLAQLRNKISQDLHDDVGSSLSSLRVYSSVVEQLMDKDREKAKAVLQKINKESARVMENIGDIVWSMQWQQGINLTGRIRDYVVGVLGTASINYSLDIDEQAEQLIRSISARKNILLIIKEAVNNALKYSGADNIEITLRKQQKAMLVSIRDNGKGFDVSQKVDGNGLHNMRGRSMELGASFDIESGPMQGTVITVLLPLTTIGDKGQV